MAPASFARAISVMRDHGTERPGSCALLHEKRSGVFACAGCEQELFASKLNLKAVQLAQFQ